MNAKDIFKITVNLVVVYVVGGVLLAALYAKTSPIIFQANQKEKEEALQKMIPSADTIEKLGDWYPHEKHCEYYKAQKGGEVIGYIVQSMGKGYSSYIDLLFAVDKDMKIQKMEILKQGETPGLGDEIMVDSFKGQFPGKDINHLKVVKTETTQYIQALTGATISSRAVTEDAMKNGLKFLQEKLGGSSDNQDQHQPQLKGGNADGSH
ncbi:RnfABCDGE type electron transport complex subunit G [Candidatus Magnetobacterium casense]|uniref:Ion-translocating oxidoreductase complex subunit G n=1 Tax=Candidatus Magnetobacterium casense TaxID=1455061 RepID=A0ABS6S1T1_9BACT|nr:RnfABCDGE type electron transport complex subunit G [Candidatus Magnetobacterium casensis]MBV6342799.1 RnfABCDGE type electron transport complex subunit G [Candidatus Magnetobacterium casensis]